MQHVRRGIRAVLRLLRGRLQSIMSRVWWQFVVCLALCMWRICRRVTESLGRQRRRSCRYLAKWTVCCEAGVIGQTSSTYGAAATFKTAFKLCGLLGLLVVGRWDGRKQRSAGTACFRHGEKRYRTCEQNNQRRGVGRWRWEAKTVDSTIVRHDWTSVSDSRAHVRAKTTLEWMLEFAGEFY